MIKQAGNIDDAELFYMIRSGGETAKKAFAELYSRHSARVYSYCKRFLGNKEEAEDVFQETFSRFYQSAQKERIMTNVPAFLLRIARNLCVNNRRQRKQTYDIDEIALPHFDSSNERKELLTMVSQAMELLPDDYREAFILREYEGLSYAEISEITDTSLSNVKIRIFRAKQKIREILAPILKDIEKNC